MGEEIKRDEKIIEKLGQIIARKGGISEKVMVVFTRIVEMFARGENRCTDPKEISANDGSRGTKEEQPSTRVQTGIDEKKLPRHLRRQLFI